MAHLRQSLTTRLRLRFIAASMIAIGLVVVVIILGINALLYVQNQSRMDAMLDLLDKHQGNLPESLNTQEAELLNLSPDGFYHVPYVAFKINEEGRIFESNQSHYRAASGEALDNYAREAWSSGAERGNISHFRFLVHRHHHNSRIILLDSHHWNLLRQNFVLNSIIITILALSITFVFVLLASHRIVQPFLDNYRLQRRFITDAGHELKTPLSIILANINIIEITQGQSEWTNSIHRQVFRMTSLVNELLKLATMEERGPVNYKSTVDLTAMVHETLNAFQAMIQRENGRFEAHIAPSVTVRGDSQSLYNLFSVLVDNAIKYATSNATIKVTLNNTPRGGAVFSISNPSENPPNTDELNRLFERFYRQDESRNSKSGGFGIGLSMAKAIVEAHKGRISASCKNGIVCFTVWI